jgi:phosphate:Na+ symporter
MGLDALKHSVPDLRSNPDVLAFLAHYADMGMLSTLIFIGVGTILTLLVQSSSAAMALTLVMCNQGWIPFELAAAMVLGENIGTTITANLAALIGNVHAKRAARAHLIFNVFGVVWMFFVFRLFLQAVDSFMMTSNGVSPLDPEQYESIPIALSIFHSAFNIINVLLLIGFVPVIVKIAEKMVPSRGEADEETKLEYIGTGILATPELSIVEAKKEIIKFGKITKRMFGLTTDLLELKEGKQFNEQLRRIAKYEDITDKMEIEIAEYLTKVSQRELSEHLALRIRGMLSIVNDLERVGDICYQISKSIERKREQKTEFNEDQRANMLKMFGTVQEAVDVMLHNLSGDYSQVNIRNADLLEVEINNTRDTLRTAHLQSIAKAEYSFESGMFYNDLFSSCEKLGDHIFNVNEAVVGIK